MKAIKITFFLGMFICLFFSCREEHIEDIIIDAAISTDLIDITGVYIGNDNKYIGYPMGGGSSTLTSAYLKVDSINLNTYSFHVFTDSLYTDTLWVKYFSTLDEPILQCNYYHMMYLTSIQLRTFNCDSIIFSESEMIGHTTYGQSFLGKKMD